MLMHASPRTSRGFTLIEAAFVLGFLAVVGIAFAAWKEGFLRDSMTRRTAEGFVLIQEALYTWRLNPDHGYAWPSAIASLDIYLPNFSGGGRNGIGQPYSLDPPPPPVSPTDGIVIETDMLSAEAATDVARLFPLTGAVSGTSVRVGVPVPGHEPARDAVLARDGAKAMLGSLDMDGHDIVALDDLGAARVDTARVDAGQANVRDLLTDSLAVGGSEIQVAGEVLEEHTIRFLNSLASMNCGTSQRVRVAGGTPTCVSVELPSAPVVTPPPPPPPPQCPGGRIIYLSGPWYCTTTTYLGNGRYCGYNCRWEGR